MAVCDNIVQFAIDILNSLPLLPLSIGSSACTVFTNLANILAQDEAIIQKALVVNSEFNTGFSAFVGQLHAIVQTYSSDTINVTPGPLIREAFKRCYWPLSPTSDISPELLEREIQDASVDYTTIILQHRELEAGSGGDPGIMKIYP